MRDSSWPVARETREEEGRGGWRALRGSLSAACRAMVPFTAADVDATAPPGWPREGGTSTPSSEPQTQKTTQLTFTYSLQAHKWPSECTGRWIGFRVEMCVSLSCSCVYDERHVYHHPTKGSHLVTMKRCLCVYVYTCIYIYIFMYMYVSVYMCI